MQTVSFRRPIGQRKGRQVQPDARARIEALFGDAPMRRDLLIEHLHRIQDAQGCLPAGLLAALAERMRLSQAEVYEVASFYHHFDVVREGEAPPPALTVRVCASLSCEMAGSRALIESLATRLGRELRVQPVPCVGRCADAPVAVVGQRPVAPASVERIEAAIADGDRACPLPDPRAGAIAGYGDLATYRAHGGYRQLARVLAQPSQGDAVLAELESSALRGLGGAGFPVARKWRAVAAQPGPRLLVVNADEGEPGTFKDRHYLERAPHRMLEGMLIAAAVVGCEACYVYLRDEYAGVRALLEREIDALRADPPFAAPLPRIELRRGAGAYICGEESALIESIEGKRGMPRLRPPYVAERGLFGRPTLVHNVETLHWVPEILERGAAWFASHGRRGRHGLRSFSVSGRVREPGVKLAPAGISLRELIDEHCAGMSPGHELYAWLPGGASGGILPASLADEPLDFDTLQPHGAFIGSAAIVVLSRRDSAADAARNLMAFFRSESCGQCTPCRVGTAKALERMREQSWDAPLLAELSGTMIDASICGLGQAAPNPMLSVMRWFPDEVHGR
ncbi:MAG: NAD(P)H-dependent oxidoreductase subunit E [Burkholderiaceae bacterium]|nr:NAD(P)H-dependent oxidoreductase subunit E [Burkholderiaceae bacterium]